MQIIFITWYISSVKSQQLCCGLHSILYDSLMQAEYSGKSWASE
jgi:hypothetical protein